MKKRIKKKFYDLYHQEVSLLEKEYTDRWDFENAVAELNFYLNQTTGIGRKIKLLRDSMRWDSSRDRAETERIKGGNCFYGTC